MTKPRVVIHDRALRDLEGRSEYIRQHNPRAAIRFLDAAEATFRFLAKQPGIGTRYNPDQPALAELRFLPISRFKNDCVFYRPIADGIAVLRVLHTARDIESILAEDLGIEDGANDDRANEQND